MTASVGNATRRVLALGALLLASTACDAAAPEPAKAEPQQKEAVVANQTPAAVAPTEVKPTPVSDTTPKAEPEPAKPPAVEETPPVDPLSPGARTEDERNSTSVFKAAAPATVFVTQSQVVYDRFSMRATEAMLGNASPRKPRVRI